MIEYRKLEGPIIESQKKTKMIVFLLHGWGSDGNDLIQLGYQWKNISDKITFISPNGPESCDANPLGKQWFSIDHEDFNNMSKGLLKAKLDLTNFIKQQLKKYSLNQDQFIIVGFSQGTMLALNIALTMQCMGVIGYSGAYIKTPLDHIIPKNNILLIHGENDDIVPLKRMNEAAKEIEKYSQSITTHVCKKLGHSIDQEGLKLAEEFITKKLQKEIHDE